jgi:DNA repair photolyase
MEPRASSPGARLETIDRLRTAGVPVGVNFAPVIPGLNDHEATAVLGAAAQAGAQFAGMTMVRLPLTVAPLFTEWLERHYPDRKEKILSRIRSMRDGKLNSTRFGDRMRGHGPVAEQIRQLFDVGCRRAGLTRTYPELSTAAFRRSDRRQLELW